jgi:mRNA-degrading endonuclease RelE of RelBE toxin-antitoxin system
VAFIIELTYEAEKDLDGIRSFYRNQILDALDDSLQYTPTQVNRSRIKRLRGIDSPAYRLRVGEHRVYYDVDLAGETVTILRILTKEESLRYLNEVADENNDN